MRAERRIRSTKSARQLIPVLCIETPDIAIVLCTTGCRSIRLSGKSVSELYGCNVALLGMENVLNGMFLEMAKRINEKPETDPKIPFNMLGVSFLNVEQIHRAQDRPRIYTSGVRAVFFIDGFAVPVYGKGYVMKYGDKYRLFSVLTTDSANEMVIKASFGIAAASVK